MNINQVFLMCSLILLISNLNGSAFSSEVRFPQNFMFGIATAPGHSEDGLNDIWLHFAKKNKVVSFSNQAIPEERLRFWSSPEEELNWAQTLGVDIYRLGVDWGRIAPNKDTLDESVIERYGVLLSDIKNRNMKVMLTLFHHSEPEWTLQNGSWMNKDMVNNFVNFSKKIVDSYHDKIDYLITFNEAQMYITLTQLDDLWPNPKKPHPLGLIDVGPIKGRFYKSLKNMAEAHQQIFNYVKEKYPEIKIGIAHNAADYRGENLISKLSAKYSFKRFNYVFPDLLEGKLDFLGVNYYGAEIVKGLSVKISNNFEYSESGRAISPNGFYNVLMKLHKRFNKTPIIITENGIADSTDWFRPAYLYGHLKALRRAMDNGVDVHGYIFWTLSDNWEWADGYCPKFGLLEVDRENNLKRTPRSSFYIYQKIIKDKGFFASDADFAWDMFVQHIGEMRPFCRAKNGKDGLNLPIQIPVRSINWRFSI